MRKVTQQIVKAFLNGESKKIGNSEVYGVTLENGTRVITLQLHGNDIASRVNGELKITNAGWFSNTTKERLNGLPDVSISQKKGVWYLNGIEWNGNWIVVDADYNTIV